MDTKNIIAAISLSAAVIIFYSLFFQPDPQTIKQNIDKKTITEKNSEAPSLDQNENIYKLSRNEALKESDRVIFENNNITGSISLLGGVIDDLTFKKYTSTLDGNDNVVLLNPRKVENGYLIETGWATTSKNIDVPDSKTLWKIEGNNKLTPNNPVKQQVFNSSDKTYNFFSYGQIIRNNIPEISNFYILHEGLLGVFDEQLVEEDYDDIEDKKFTKNANEGWLGITDKYWIASLIPSSSKEFKAEFSYNKKFRANYIETQGTELSPNNSINNEVKVIVAAKEVDVIDGYAESLNINKFDLSIDWGWFYFFTKPLFFIADYFFKLTGNFGIAIILITICIRIIFFQIYGENESIATRDD